MGLIVVRVIATNEIAKQLIKTQIDVIDRILRPNLVDQRVIGILNGQRPVTPIDALPDRAPRCHGWKTTVI